MILLIMSLPPLHLVSCLTSFVIIEIGVQFFPFSELFSYHMGIGFSNKFYCILVYGMATAKWIMI